jgi:hypothetical protein
MSHSEFLRESKAKFFLEQAGDLRAHPILCARKRPLSDAEHGGARPG